MTAETLIPPIVHLNGTSAEELTNQRTRAYNDLETAANALRAMAPNGRDYYPEPGRLEKALAQHKRRIKAIRDIQEELYQEMGAISPLTF